MTSSLKKLSDFRKRHKWLHLGMNEFTDKKLDIKNLGIKRFFDYNVDVKVDIER